MKKVSILVITYNHEQYILKALKSIFFQKYQGEIEVIIRDDCSTDKTNALISSFIKKSNFNIVHIKEKTNTFSKGHEPMINAAKYATGEIIFFLEGDDYWVGDNKICSQVRALENNDVDLCFHPLKLEQKKKFSLKRFIGFNGKESKNISINNIINQGSSSIGISSIAVRSCCLKSLPKWFDEDMPFGDLFLQIMLSKRKGAFYLPDVFGVYRVLSQGSWTSNQTNLSLMQLETYYMQVTRKLWNLEKEFNGEYKTQFNKLKSNEYYKIFVRAIKTRNYNFANKIFTKSMAMNSSLETKAKLLIRHILKK